MTWQDKLRERGAQLLGQATGLATQASARFDQLTQTAMDALATGAQNAGQLFQELQAQAPEMLARADEIHGEISVQSVTTAAFVDSGIFMINFQLGRLTGNPQLITFLHACLATEYARNFSQMRPDLAVHERVAEQIAANVRGTESSSSSTAPSLLRRSRGVLADGITRLGRQFGQDIAYHAIQQWETRREELFQQLHPGDQEQGRILQSFAREVVPLWVRYNNTSSDERRQAEADIQTMIARRLNEQQSA